MLCTNPGFYCALRIIIISIQLITISFTGELVWLCYFQFLYCSQYSESVLVRGYLLFIGSILLRGLICFHSTSPSLCFASRVSWVLFVSCFQVHLRFWIIFCSHVPFWFQVLFFPGSILLQRVVFLQGVLLLLGSVLLPGSFLPL